MRLVYSIPDKLWWIKEFLPPAFYKDLHNSIIQQREKLKFHSAKGLWPKALLDYQLEAPDRLEIKDYKPFEELKILVKHNPFFQMNPEKMTTTLHSMKKGAGIDWHDDHKWKYGATYYINRRWNENWGGEFMFTENNGHGWIPPVGNSLVIVKAPISHKVNPILSPIIPRISVQMFMK